MRVNSAARIYIGANIVGMAIEDRRTRERAARRRLITATARKLAEEEGWDAVTTRRLSAEIEYSQPVLYKHFAGMEGIVASVAVQGFAELGDALSAARSGAADGRDALARVAHAFTGFARDNQALFDAMFTRATTLPFAADDTPPELNAAFDELRAAVDMVAGARDPDTLAEVVWATLHGLITLDRSGRLRPEFRDARIDILVSEVCAGT
jgi:AcrR family transcriptional regulator